MGSKKELQAAIAVLGLCMLVFGCTKTAESENSKKQVKIGVAVYNEEDVYVSKICGYLEDEIFQYEKDHPGVEIRKRSPMQGAVSRSRTTRSISSSVWTMIFCWSISWIAPMRL